MEQVAATRTGRGRTVIAAMRILALLASTVMAAVLAHDLVHLVGETPAGLVLGIPIAFLLARWAVWVRSLLPQPAAREAVEAASG